MLVIHIFLLLMVGFSAQVGAYDEVQLKKLKALGSCPSCDLSEANLEGANLYKADLKGANLKGADLGGANLKGANLTGANLTNAIMKDAHIQGIIFCRTQTPWGEDNSGC
jgi:uncharacterized protein YjbI with pentapeptide repeats